MLRYQKEHRAEEYLYVHGDVKPEQTLLSKTFFAAGVNFLMREMAISS